MSRYSRRVTAINFEEQYDKMFEQRGVLQIEQYRTPISTPVEQKVLDSIEYQSHMWSMGDSYWRLARLFYGDSRYWWIIASFNKKPTEAHNLIGDEIRIPVNLSEALQVVS